MVGDDIQLIVEFEEELRINEIQYWLLLKLQNIVHQSHVRIKKSRSNLNPASPTLWDEFLVDFDNDFKVPATFGISYYNIRSNMKRCKLISLGAMNHPAGEILIDNGEKFGSALKDDLSKLVLLTNDSEFMTLEVITKYYLENLEGCGIIGEWE